MTQPTDPMLQPTHDHNNDQIEDDEDSDDGFTPVLTSSPRRSNAGKGVARLNIGSFKGKSYHLDSFEADFIDKTKR